MKFTITLSPTGYSIENPGGGFHTCSGISEPDLDELMGTLRSILRKYFSVAAGGCASPGKTQPGPGRSSAQRTREVV